MPCAATGARNAGSPSGTRSGDLALAYAAAHPARVAAVGYLSGVGIGDWRRPYRAARAAAAGLLGPDAAARRQDLARRVQTHLQELVGRGEPLQVLGIHLRDLLAARH